MWKARPAARLVTAERDIAMADPRHAVASQLPPPPRQRRAPTSTAVLLIAAFGAFLAFLDSTIVNVAFPSIRASFPHSSISTMSWVLNAYNIVFGAFLVASGRIADLLGRRRIFMAGIVLFTVSSVACAVAATPLQLILFRIAQGFGAALLVPASLALVVETFPADRLPHAVTLWGAAAALAAGLGPPIGAPWSPARAGSSRVEVWSRAAHRGTDGYLTCGGLCCWGRASASSRSAWSRARTGVGRAR